jgi:hypothetical protein
MASVFQDGLAIPYLIGVNKSISNNKDLFIGLQGMYTLNLTNKITANTEYGLCLGINY